MIKTTYPKLVSPDKILEQRLNKDTAQIYESNDNLPLPEYIGTVHRYSIDFDTALDMLRRQKLVAEVTRP